MKRLFDPETPIMQRLTRYSNIILCGTAWFFCCLLVIPAGAASTAIARVMFSIREDKPAGLGLFFKTLIGEFGKSTLLWIADLFCAALLALLLWSIPADNAMLYGVMFAPLLLWAFTFLYAFPLNAYFENSVIQTLKNALLMSLRHFRQTVPALTITMLPVFTYLFLGNYYFLYLMPLWLFFLFPFTAYWKSRFLLEAFYNYAPRPISETESDTDTQ